MQEKIAKLRKARVYIGTSSWKYSGWKGIVFNREYRSEKEFNEKCLEEYAQHFSAVGVDHTYYTWPTEAHMKKYAEQTPADFRFGLKVTEKVTVFKYPNLKRYGKEAGKPNGSFLDPGAFRENFLPPLEAIRPKLGPLMLEFSQFYPGTISSGSEFVSRLDTFFSELSDLKELQFAVEMRNANWLKAPYFEMLQKHRVAHVFNSWTRMPEVEEQLALTKGFELPAYVARLLLQPGTKYEEAVEAFSPYDRLQEEHPKLRAAGAALIRRAIEAGVPAYVFVNNRAEGCAPKTIEAILALIDI